MEERAAAILAAIPLTGQVNAGKACLMRQIHDLLGVLAVTDEFGAAAEGTFLRPAFAASMDGERRAVRLGVGHYNTRQVERQHGVFIKRNPNSKA